MAKKFRTKAACRIADVNPLRLNEAIYAGNYPCAPETKSGSARVFEEVDLMGLSLWGKLMKDPDIHRATVGDIVCSFLSYLKMDHMEEIERLDFPKNPFGFMNPAKAEQPISFTYAVEKRHAFYAMSFDVKAIREEVRARIAEEMEIIGEED
ncbi:MAG: hypothetical protein RIA08_10835 [Roseovarius sp.]|uniref:hypothetical protein n=1 Tax=Roseovarius sp. TaxID=1486281 RepID=UPI0032EF4FB0